MALNTKVQGLTVSGYLHTLYKNHSQKNFRMSFKFVLGKTTASHLETTQVVRFSSWINLLIFYPGC